MKKNSKIIRTKTRASGGITDAERAQMESVSREWIDIAYRTTPIDPAKITDAIHRLYIAANLKVPRVVIAPSPLVMAFAYGASAAIWHRRKTDSTTDIVTFNATRIAADNATFNATANVTRNATFNATDIVTANATLNAIANAETGAARACYDLAGSFGLECAAQWMNSYQGGNMWAGWCSYLAAMRDVIGLRLPEHIAYQAWEDAAREGGFRVMHKEFCIVSDFPEFIRIDDQNRPHCESGPSHRWRDGWSLYHWHGVAIPAEWIEERASLTPQIALTWRNIEQRRAACEILGWAKILAALKARIIHEDLDPEIGTLVEVDIPDIGKERFLRVLCGTGREFALPVPPTMKTAIQAQAWTYGYDDPKDFLPPEVRT